MDYGVQLLGLLLKQVHRYHEIIVSEDLFFAILRCIPSSSGEAKVMLIERLTELMSAFER